jgi:hypothetical protein
MWKISKILYRLFIDKTIFKKPFAEDDRTKV